MQKNSNNISNQRRRNRVTVKDKKTGVRFSPTPVSLMVIPERIAFFSKIKSPLKKGELNLFIKRNLKHYFNFNCSE